MNNDETVLITGGAGFIGSALSIKLIRKGYKVRVLDTLSEQIHGEVPSESELFNKIINKVQFVQGDVRNKDDWRVALEGADIVVHLAAETGTGQSMYEIDKYIDVNIKGTSNLLDILTNEQHTVKKIVVASSRAIYGEGKYKCEQHGIVYPVERVEKHLSKGDFNVKCPRCEQDVSLLATSEDSKIHPTSVYGFTKYSQEDMCMIVGKSLGIPVAAFRYQNVYGPGQSLKNPYTGILSIFSTRIKNGNDINIFEDGEETRDFVYIDDVVEATVLGIESDRANFESFNVGTGIPTDVLTVANTLITKYGAKVNTSVSGNYRLGDIRHNYADLSKIEKLLKFKPSYNFEQGITNFVNWVETQSVEEDSYDKAMIEMKEKGLYK
ncbi:NAD-dependent epimerase/dehydratase family protein [Pseudalkalibacillus sp. JSM 102089]|uniref:NAD-dependent epimerase/dehydratase family protein n=1 Tax=Pseudalkalibacillus sp. JSM 102089 TaxID=3229856 RepID=UPI003524837A